ncbi:hypothetical protein [Paraliomyxa miuraensis]|uniref:hypothetical protein n=1 Tax=Paraliomyxa miuraensis TaxID=376150 RepID=UPI0022525E24|nr:hypothetical protein [Paraliomyxa miuraensis]MCX4241920.1 hypothetical protein [Paraliomyxa miuraensis]
MLAPLLSLVSVLGLSVVEPGSPDPLATEPPLAEDASTAGPASPSAPTVPSAPAVDGQPEPPASETPPPSEGAPSDGTFFDPGLDEDETAPPEPEPEAEAPPMPEIEELPPRPSTRRWVDRTRPSPERPPAGSEGGSFFDPGKLEDTGPAGGLLQIRGYVAANFFVATRSNTLAREPSGEFERLRPMPFFDVSSATLYVGAPIYADMVHARMAVEFLSIPQTQITASQPDIIAQANRRLFFESAALEVNPFATARSTPRWFREGFKITGGVFIVPFGLEDEEHASPANWFISRPRSMTSNRVYPGTWNDVGVALEWKPTFREHSPIRPIQIDLAMVNGDPCTQTRFLASLYEPNFPAPSCARRLRPAERDDPSATVPEPLPINAGFFGIAPDNNANKAFVARVRTFPIPSLDLGGSFVFAKHPEPAVPEPGQTTAELDQAPSWRAGGHVDLRLSEAIGSRVPLPSLRGELVLGVDHAVDETTHADRRMLGGYAQISQPLFVRKRTRLPGLMVQYRFDHADPDLVVPGIVDGVPLRVDLSSFDYRGETTLQGHTVGLRLPVVPRLMLKAEYTFVLEDGGRGNRIANDLFGFEAVADF